MRTEDWGALYRNLVQVLPVYVRDARLTICGLSSFLDGYVRLHEAESLLNAEKGTPEGALSRELFQRASTGIGGEYYMDWSEGGKWVEENLQVSRWGLEEPERKLPKRWLSSGLLP